MTAAKVCPRHDMIEECIGLVAGELHDVDRAREAQAQLDSLLADAAPTAPSDACVRALRMVSELENGRLPEPVFRAVDQALELIDSPRIATTEYERKCMTPPPDDDDADRRRALAAELAHAKQLSAQIEAAEKAAPSPRTDDDALSAEPDKARELLRLILPMAKGYAAEHRVGNNAQFVADAETYLAAQDQPQAAPTAAEPDVERVEQRPTSFRQCPSCKAMWYHNTPEWHEHNCRWNNTDAPNRAA